MQNGKKYYLNVSSYKYKREYMKLHQPHIDKILNTYTNHDKDILIESPNLCPGGKRCKNYLIIMNLEQKIKELNDKVNQLTKIKEYSESNHNIDFTPLKTMENRRKDAFNEICNSFRNSGIKKKLNNSTRNMPGNNTLQPQISEPYRLKLDYKNNNDENKMNENKKWNGKKLINLDINKFKNIGIKINAEKLGIDEKSYLSKREENNDIKNNNSNYDEKEKKIQNLINHIFNNKNNEILINKKEESKNKEILIKKGDTKTIKKINFPKLKVKPYNLLIPNKANKINNKRYNTDILETENKNDIIDENKLYFRKFKGTLRNSFNSTKNKILSKSLGFNNNLKEEKNNFFNLTEKCSKTVLEDKKQSLYKLTTLNGFRPLSITQKPFRLKINISQNDFINEGKAKSERKESINFDGNKEKILLKKNSNEFDFETFIYLFNDRKSEKYKIFDEIYNLSKEKYDSIIDKIKSISNEKINDYILFIKYSLTYIKDLVEIIEKLRILYNITDTNDNNKNKLKSNISKNDEMMSYIKNIQRALSCDSIHIYIYDAKTDSLILKGENEEIQYPKDKDLIGKCFTSGKPLNYKIDENSVIKESSFLKYRQLDINDKIFIYPIKDIDNNILGVFEVINKNLNTSNSDTKCSFDKKDEIIMSFISKLIGSSYICF